MVCTPALVVLIIGDLARVFPWGLPSAIGTWNSQLVDDRSICGGQTFLAYLRGRAVSQPCILFSCAHAEHRLCLAAKHITDKCRQLVCILISMNLRPRLSLFQAVICSFHRHLPLHGKNIATNLKQRNKYLSLPNPNCAYTGNGRRVRTSMNVRLYWCWHACMHRLS